MKGASFKNLQLYGIVALWQTPKSSNGKKRKKNQCFPEIQGKREEGLNR